MDIIVIMAYLVLREIFPKDLMNIIIEYRNKYHKDKKKRIQKEK